MHKIVQLRTNIKKDDKNSINIPQDDLTRIAKELHNVEIDRNQDDYD